MKNIQPHHKRLFELLKKHIAEGIYKEGDLLPSENELCLVHGVTRPTVRQALHTLVNEGLIKKQQGKGSIVIGTKQGIGILSISSTTSALGSENLSTNLLVKPVVKPWPTEFMFPLTDTEKHWGCIYMERLRMVNNVPIFYDINYLPNIHLPRFTSRSLNDKSLFDILKKYYNIEVKGGEQKINALVADNLLSSQFQLPIGKPVLHLERKLHTNISNYFIYSSIYCNTENYCLYGSF